MADIEDSIRTNVSVGYIVHDVKELDEKDGKTRYLVTRWEPLEISLVSVPADPIAFEVRGNLRQIGYLRAFRMHQVYLSIVLGLVAFTVAGSTTLNVKTWLKARDEHEKQRLVEFVILMTFLTSIALMVVAVWTS